MRAGGVITMTHRPGGLIKCLSGQGMNIGTGCARPQDVFRDIAEKRLAAFNLRQRNTRRGQYLERKR
jgi:hypothetical protein